jgi:hypothetical protein
MEKIDYKGIFKRILNLIGIAIILILVGAFIWWVPYLFWVHLSPQLLEQEPEDAKLISIAIVYVLKGEFE